MLHGVGYLTLGKGYNHRIYKIKGKGYFKVLEKLQIYSTNSVIFDIGSRVGSIIYLWSSAGFSEITGIDMTNVMLRTKTKYPILNSMIWILKK